AVEEAKGSRVRLLELRCRTSLPLELPASHRKITVVLDLPADANTLFQSFPSKLRSQIRRPQREGVTVRFGLDHVDPFFEVFSRHMRDLGTPTLPRRFFRAIAAQFPEDVWFGCAWLGNQPIACGAGFRWGAEFELSWASSLSGWNRIAPNMLLYWSFLERAIAEGVTLFNFGRCTPNSGTHRFKRQWGSRDVPLWWYQWTPNGGAEAATPSPDQPKYAWGPRLWRHLPLGLSRMLGPWIVKSIP
ncbi:MAG: GNAT family N-acetyltransferase, partial [Gemmatimonadales bacterium]